MLGSFDDNVVGSGESEEVGIVLVLISLLVKGFTGVIDHLAGLPHYLQMG